MIIFLTLYHLSIALENALRAGIRPASKIFSVTLAAISDIAPFSSRLIYSWLKPFGLVNPYSCTNHASTSFSQCRPASVIPYESFSSFHSMYRGNPNSVDGLTYILRLIGPLCRYELLISTQPILNVNKVANESNNRITSNWAVAESFHTVFLNLSRFS